MKPVLDFYAKTPETGRLSQWLGQQEFARTQEILTRFLPPAAAVILDVGVGDGVYSAWLGSPGYQTHLIDITRAHIHRAPARAEWANPGLSARRPCRRALKGVSEAGF